ncbi:MAG: hypothetical protein HY033_00760 [Ignavibacteriae bacterium]|nr:hypothetical protein [Ignavibacteria bacterium]MBI3363420.1 hypothetical protein [Ignavibacteriota bacterium]
MHCTGLITLLFLFVQISPAQRQSAANDSLQRYFQYEDASPLSCLFTYFPPFLIQHGIELQQFVRSKTFRTLRKQFGDIRAVDALYIHAMRMTNNNTAVSLFLSMVAVLEHRTIGLKVPVFNLAFPLTNESDEDFQRRVRNLPAQLYADTPHEKAGDKDKLQHFFGSAFLTFIFESRGPADRIGNFIEEGEEAIIVEGNSDPRDVRANRQGQRFGLALLDDNHRLPSEFLKISKPHLTVVNEAKCIGVW